MPSSDTVLVDLTAIASDWRWLAITWHVLLAALTALLLAGWRPAIFSNLGSTSWSTLLAGTGLVYSLIGVFRLGVALDSALLLAAGVLGAAVAVDVTGWRSVRADRSERRRALPGDRFISEPLRTLTHAITIGRPPCAVWPWLIQMGAGSRAGWYSYDVLDNGRKPSAARIVPELQGVAIGSMFPALPGVTEGFTVLASEPYRSLILGWPTPGGEPLVTWAFVLEERACDSTRLIVRARGGQGYRFHGLPLWACRLGTS